MSETKKMSSETRVAPIFILADDDRAACAQLIMLLPQTWFYIPVSQSNQVVRYSKEFATTAVFLADQMYYAQGGAERLLQKLLDEVGKPVVILAELWDPETAERWKRMGAVDCLPHPTRTERRTTVVRDKMRQLGLAQMRGEAPVVNQNLG